MTARQPRLFTIWLDASDGSIATYDGVQWPDGTADVHHRYRRPDGVQWSPEALAKTIHGKLARIEWTPDAAAELRERADRAEQQVARVRTFLEDMAGWCSPHGVAADYAQRALDALDGVDPLGLAGPTREELAEADDGFRWHVLSECPDETACPIHGLNEGEPTGPEDGVDLPELTAEDAVEAMEDMAGELYTAQDRLAFVREMCDQADRDGKAITTEQVRAWTQYTGCANATPDGAELARSLGFALAAMLPGAEPVFCHHENAQHSAYTTHQAGWGRKTVRTVSCPNCKARAESTEGEPVLAPTVLNAERCTQACTERHTNGPGCLMTPDWSKPLITLPQAMKLHSLTGRIIDQAQRERWQAAGRCGTCGFDGDRTGCRDCDGGRS